MVLGEFIQSLWDSNEAPNEEKNNSINFPQGARFLEFKLDKTRKMQSNLNLISNSNGYSPEETLKGQRSLKKAANQNMDSNLELIEGFSGMIGATDANAKNSQDLAKLKQLEDTFNKKLSTYVTAQKVLNDKIQTYMKASSFDNKKYFNQNAKFSNAIGYVTDKGVWKHYPNPDNYTNTKGKNGCPAGNPITMQNSGTTLPTSMFAMTNPPNLMFGTKMKSGQACGNEGKNIYVTQLYSPGDVEAKYEGCYNASLDQQGLVFQSDIGHKSTIAQCAMRASDMGLDGFALGKGGEGKAKCYVATGGVDKVKRWPGPAEDKWKCVQPSYLETGLSSLKANPFEDYRPYCNGGPGKQPGLTNKFKYTKKGRNDCKREINNSHGAVRKKDLKCPNLWCDVKNVGGKSVGFSKSHDMVAVYSIPKISKASLGKVGYVTDDAQLREYPESMTEPNSTFYNMGYYTSGGNNIKSLKNTTLEECKSKCSSEYSDKCAGFAYHENTQACNLKNDKMFPVGKRTESSKSQLYVRGKSVTNGATCPTEVVESTAQLWDAYPEAGRMTKNAMCQVAFMTKEEKKKFETAHEELQGIAGEIQEVLAKLTETDEKLVESLGYNVKKLKRDIKQYTKIKNEKAKRKGQLQNSGAMESSSDLNMVSQNSKYIMWSILAILLVTTSIRTRR